MGKATVNWDSQETWQRVVAAIIASGVKVQDLDSEATTLSLSLTDTSSQIDQKQVALYFGTTYDTSKSHRTIVSPDKASNSLTLTSPLVENRFRKIKKEAQVLKEEVESGERGEIAPARKSAPSTPRKPRATPKKDALSS
jgi:hypothetical protein